MASTLKNKAVKGFSWSLIETLGIYGMKFILGVLLARMLTPADFGLIAMISVFFAVADELVHSGLGLAYVQKKEVSYLDANTIFYTNLVISMALYGALWAASPLIAGFYGQPELIELSRVMGLVIIINAFNVIQLAQLTRAVDFKRKTKVTLNATLVSGIAGVSAAYMGFGVWSLVIQLMVNRFLTTLGLWITSRWKPAFQFSMESFHSMFSFGAWILASRVLSTVFDNIYILTIGKMFPASQLGFYSKAKSFNRLYQHVSGIVGIVTFPILSQLQDDKPKLKQVMSKSLTHTLVFTVPTLVILVVVAEPFVILLLTDKWSPMIPYFQLLCISGIFYPVHAVNLGILKAQGKSQLNFNLAVIKAILRIINIVIMYRWGVFYIILGEVFVSILALAINTYYTKQLINYGIVDQFRDTKYIWLSAVLAGCSGYLATNVTPNLYIHFFVGSFVTGSVFILMQFIFNRVLFIEIIKLKEIFVK